MNDIYEVLSGGHFDLTLRKLCKIVFDGDDSMIPPELEETADKTADEVMADIPSKTEGLRIIFDYYFDQSISLERITGYIKSGIIVFTPRTVKNDEGKLYPSIYAEDPKKCWIKLGQYLKGIVPMPTIGVTGSSGKTTVSMMANCVFAEKYNVFCPTGKGRNLNNHVELVHQWLLHGGSEYDFHIQECGGGTPRHVERQAATLGADVFGITNIETSQHLKTYGSADALINDKLSFDSMSKESAIGVINIDDAILAGHRFSHKVKTFAIDNKKADCVAENIVQNEEYLEFDALYEGKSTHIKINIAGKMNVYNALMVFLFAKLYGLSDREIQKGFLNYKSTGIRQRLDSVGGRLLYVDCYNHSINAMSEALKTLEDLELPEGGRRIAVIGERESGSEEIYGLNYEAGKNLSAFQKIDRFIFLEQDVKTEGERLRANAIFNGAREVMGEGRTAQYKTVKDIAEVLKKETKRGDAILLKGALKYYMFRIFDIAYGTSYAISYMQAAGKAGTPVETDMLRAVYMPMLGGANVRGVKKRSATIVKLPAEIEKREVVRIGNRSFAECHLPRYIFLGYKVRTIGKHAFRGCISLERLYLPKNTAFIDTGAFEDCDSLALASLPGVCHVAEGAFKNCIHLKKAVFTESCGFIGENAFEGCKALTFFAPEDSYAAQYALRKGFGLVKINSKAEVSKLFADGTPRYDGRHIASRFDSVKKIGDEPCAVCGKKAAAGEENAGNKVNISVTVCGDVMAHGNQLATALDEAKGEYRFEHYFDNVAGKIKKADVAVCNVETTFGPGAYTGFPKFNSPDYLAEAIGKAGFDVAACANNHIYDTKYAGVIRTKKTLENNGLAVSGIRDDAGQRGYCLVERKGVSTAVLNYTYRTRPQGRRPTLNLNVVDEDAFRLINTFSYETLDDDLLRIEEDVKSARKDGADIVIVYYHWGCEYETEANVLQRYMAYKTAKMGADAVIGSHPHVMQGTEMLKIESDGKSRKVPVFYSLGNFIWGGCRCLKETAFLKPVLLTLNLNTTRRKNR